MKKKPIQKLLSLCLAMVVLLSALTGISLPASAEETEGDMLDYFYREGYEFYQEAPFEYVIYQNEAWITDCEKTVEGKLEVPSSLGGYPVTTLLCSFSQYNDLKEFILPDTVTTINGNFTRCEKLRSVTIPDSVVNITGLSFSNCSQLKNVSLPNNMTSIPMNVFYDCKALESIVIPDSVTSIEASAFDNCSSLPEISLPKNLISIGERAFAGCSSLPEITLPDSTTTIGASAFASCLNLTDIVLPNSLQSIGKNAFGNCGYYNDETNWETEWKANVLYIGDYLIEASASDSYTVKAGIKGIADAAFQKCTELKKVTLPDSVRFIGDSAFSGCESLVNVNMPYNLTDIGDSAFYETALPEITIPGNVQRIGVKAFKKCNDLKTLIVSDGVKCIGESAFSECSSLTNITLPDSLTSIGNGAFYDTRFYYDESNWEKNQLYIGTNLITSTGYPDPFDSIKDGTTLIADYACIRDSIEDLTLPNTVTHIGNYAFYTCRSLEDVTISSSVVSIGDYAFFLCDSLDSITIPPTVTEIGEYAVGYSRNYSEQPPQHVKDFTIYGTPGSAAETYANENGITFVSVEKPTDPTTKPATDPTTVPQNQTTTTANDTVILPSSDSGIAMQPDIDLVMALPDMTADDFYAAFPDGSVTLRDTNGNWIRDDAPVGTGTQLVLSNPGSGNLPEYTVLIMMDVDGDSRVTASDARLTLRYAATLESLGELYVVAADPNLDESVTATDARKILRVSAKLDPYAFGEEAEPEPEPPQEEKPVDYANEYYGPVLTQYKQAKNGGMSAEGTWLNEIILQFVIPAGESVYYALYDIDGNGTPELLIGAKRGEDIMDIYDLFTYANGTIHRFSTDIQINDIGYRTFLNINTKHNTIIIDGSGGASYHQWDFYRYGADGHTPQLLDTIVFDDWVYYRGANEDTVLNEVEVAELWDTYTGYVFAQDSSDITFDWQLIA